MKPNESTVSGYRRFECNSNGNKGGEIKSICIDRACKYENAHGTYTYICSVPSLAIASPPPPSYIYIYTHRANKSVVSAHERDTIESNRHFVRS